MGRFVQSVFVAAMILAAGISIWPGKGICYGFDMGLHSLAGLEGVLLGVKDLPRDVEGKGITKKQMVDDITTQLTKANIKLETPQESLVSPGAPALLVAIGLSKIQSTSKTPSGYFYSVHVGLSQAVTLVRDANIGLHVDTWSAEDLGQISKLGEIRAKVKAMIERFVAAYQAANMQKPDLETREPTLHLSEPKGGPELEGSKPEGSKKVQ